MKKNPSIIGVALSAAGKFLGFIDGKGKIRKGRVRRLRNPWKGVDPKKEAKHLREYGTGVKPFYLVAKSDQGPGTGDRTFSSLVAAKKYAMKEPYGKIWKKFRRYN